MPVQTFNERFLGNAPVPPTGTIAGAGPPAVGASAKGTPKAVDQADGTANLRSDGVHKQAALLNPNSTGKDHRPSAVATFQDATV